MNLNNTGIIYKATLTIFVNDSYFSKSYIGQTVQTLDIRKREHARSKRNDKFHQACKKYSVDAFKWTILEDNVPLDKMNEREDYFITLFDTVNTGFNQTHIGYDRSLRFKLSQSERQKRIMRNKKSSKLI